MSTSEFREWCIVELFGHQKTAGVVTSQELGGESFVRVDVPAIGERKAFTRLFGKGAIYSLMPTDEPTVQAFLTNCWQAPIERFMLEDRSLPSVDDDDRPF